MAHLVVQFAAPASNCSRTPAMHRQILYHVLSESEYSRAVIYFLLVAALQQTRNRADQLSAPCICGNGSIRTSVMQLYWSVGAGRYILCATRAASLFCVRCSCTLSFCCDSVFVICLASVPRVGESA